MSTELRPRDLENASGAEMPFMLEGALKALFQIPKTKRTTGATDGPKSSKAFRWQLPCLATPVNCTQTGWLLQG